MARGLESNLCRYHSSHRLSKNAFLFPLPAMTMALDGSDGSVTSPPPYHRLDSPQEGGPSSTSLTTYRYPIPVNSNPTNFLKMAPPRHLDGVYVIDPLMKMPNILLRSLSDGETEETRTNALLETKNGSIDADIFVLPTGSPRTGKPRFVRIQAVASTSNVNLRIVILLLIYLSIRGR